MTAVPEQAPPPAAPETPPPASDGFVKFVRCVKDKPVTRFVIGARGGARAGNFFGARRVDGSLVYDEEAVHAITAEEWDRFGRIYQRNIDDRHLVEVKREVYVAFVEAQAARATKAEADASAPATQDAAQAAQDVNGSAAPTGGEGS